MKNKIYVFTFLNVFLLNQILQGSYGKLTAKQQVFNYCGQPCSPGSKW